MSLTLGLAPWRLRIQPVASTESVQIADLSLGTG